MWKILWTLALMVVCGVVAYVATLASLIVLGLTLHKNYQYYEAASLLIPGCGIIGFFSLAVVVSYLQRQECENRDSFS